MGIVNDSLPNIYAAEGSNWVKGLAHNIFSHMELPASLWQSNSSSMEASQMSL